MWFNLSIGICNNQSKNILPSALRKALPPIFHWPVPQSIETRRIWTAQSIGRLHFPANKKQTTDRQLLLPEKLFWEHIIESDRVRYGVKVVALCASQAESSLLGSALTWPVDFVQF